MTLICGDALIELKKMADESIDCCITSPPYWGLRDYGIRGQLGLEKTPEEYVAKMVEIFGEVKRVMKKEGAMFLNLGDSYWNSGGVQRADIYGTSDKEPEDYPNRDYLCENLCGECRRAYLIGKFRNDDSLVPKQFVLSSLPNHEHKESENDHSPTSDSSRQEVHNEVARQDSRRSLTHEPGPILSSHESKHDESSRQLRGECLRKDKISVCLLCGRTSTSCVQECGYKTVCTFGTVQTDHPLNHDKLDIVSLRKAYPDYTTMHPIVKLKPKDLVGIPWRVAFALQSDGWYLRQDIIWAKPNPMPESVTDRCTKAHEYIFLLAKNQKYYFDNEAIKEPMIQPQRYKRRLIDPDNNNRKRMEMKVLSAPRINPKTIEACRLKGLESGTRNRRSVWTVTTKPFKGAHFATFPEDLIEPIVKAGCPQGGVILDPFSGAGTTGVVAKKNNRNFIGIDLNPKYVEMAQKRIDNTMGVLL